MLVVGFQNDAQNLGYGKYNLTWNCQFLMEFDDHGSRKLKWKLWVSALLTGKAFLLVKIGDH